MYSPGSKRMCCSTLQESDQREHLQGRQSPSLHQSHRIQVKLTLMSVTRGNAADFLMMSQAENVALGKLVLEEASMYSI